MQEAPQPPPLVTFHTPELSDDELLFQSAIRALEPLLCDGDREKYMAILTSGVSNEEKAATWRARRRASSHDGS